MSVLTRRMNFFLKMNLSISSLLSGALLRLFSCSCCCFLLVALKGHALGEDRKLLCCVWLQAHFSIELVCLVWF